MMSVTCVPEFLWDGSDWDNAGGTVRGYAVIWCELGNTQHRACWKVAAIDERGYFDGEIYCCERHKRKAEAEMARRVSDSPDIQ